MQVRAFLKELVRCPSVTPIDAGAQDFLAETLEKLGFRVERVTFGEGNAAVPNLYARIGESGPNLCFAGHTDVVPPGSADLWSTDPFGAEERDGLIYGRGTADMKGGVAAFVAAAAQYLGEHGAPENGSISLLITGDEEGDAVNGTVKVLEWLDAKGEKLDACIVGEPTCREAMGDIIKIGRRGSMNGHLTVFGVQGHSGYPHLADNPLEKMVGMLDALISHRLDEGTEFFQPSTLALTSVDTGNPATNVIPARAEARFNIRFNDTHTSDSLTAWLHETLSAVSKDYELDIKVSGESFLTPPGDLSDLLQNVVSRHCGITPKLDTGGGTSDARFICHYCPVVEFGLAGQTMHKADEHIVAADLDTLVAIYHDVIKEYFSA